MRKARLAVIVLAVAALSALAVPAVLADSPHFIYANATRVGNQLTVDFKLAGVGNTDRTIVLSADAQCFNRGGNAPRAENKGAILATGTFSPKNGNIVGPLSGSAQTDPVCNPPMELRYTNVTLTDQASGESIVLPGTF